MGITLRHSRLRPVVAWTAKPPSSISNCETSSTTLHATRFQAEVRGGVDRNAAFVHFKHETTEGQSLAAAVKERSQQHKELMASVRELGASVNAAKARIDELNAALGNKRTETPAHATDSEHSSLLQVTMVHSCFWHASQGTWSTTSINIYALSTCIVMCGCQLLYRTCFAEHVYT
eukprot:1144256-Pelagomonas_calceolata.AAC.7